MGNDGALRASDRYYYGPALEGIYAWGIGIGFRVAYVPEPATIVMLALAGVGTLRRRKA